VVDYLDQESYERLLSTIEQRRDRLLAQFLYESGCTATEAAELKTNHLHRDGTLTVAGRSAKISTSLASELLEQAGSHLFTSRQEDSITPKRIQQILKPYLKRIHRGKATPLVLRYTHIIHAYLQGQSLNTICSQTGLTAVRLAQILADLPTHPDSYTLGSGGRT
jgi:site-specific recombinase XerD